MAKAIGIDLGTSYCCVGVWQGDHAEILANEYGNRKTPSYVAFSESRGWLIGEDAKEQAIMNPRNTLFNIMRLIGRRFDDPEVQSDIELFPFRVFPKNGRPFIAVEYRGNKLELCPQEIVAMILRKMKGIAEAHLGCTVTQAVITVPALFSNSTRQSVKDSATIAGLNVLRLHSAPSMATTTYALRFRNQVTVERNVMVIDVGGGKCDVALVAIDETICDVKATSGDPHLGGIDFDRRLLDHFIQEFQQTHKRDMSPNSTAVLRLLRECEHTKCALSSASSVSIKLDSLHDGIDFQATISRSKMEKLFQDLLRGILKPVEKVLRDNGMHKRNVNEVILIGGSSRMPYLEVLISNFFDGKELNKTLNPDEAAAYGAAVQSAILLGDTSETTQDVLLLEVTPLSLGIELVQTSSSEHPLALPDDRGLTLESDVTRGIFFPLIKRNTSIPHLKSEIFSSYTDNQSEVVVRVYEGESARTKDNHLLGEVRLPLYPPCPRGIPQIEVTFSIDANSILEVSCRDRTTGKSNRATITNDRERLSKEELERIIENAERYNGRSDDEMDRAHIGAKSILESYISELRRSIKTEGVHGVAAFKPADKLMLEHAIKECISWLDDTPFLPKEKYEEKQKDLESIVAEGSKNLLKSYTYDLRNSINKLEFAISKTVSWINFSPSASREDYEKKMEELGMIASAVSRELYTVSPGAQGRRTDQEIRDNEKVTGT